MKLWRVIVCHDTTMSVSLEVHAESKDEANAKVLDGSVSGDELWKIPPSQIKWELDEGNPIKPYLPDPDSTEEIPPNSVKFMSKGDESYPTPLTWVRDSIQFPRLLAELRTIGLTEQQYLLLGEAMTLEQEHIDSLLERAEEAFQRNKE